MDPIPDLKPVFIERAPKEERDLTTFFKNLTGNVRFADLKKELWNDSLTESWHSVLEALKMKTDEVARKGSIIIPEISYTGIQAGISQEKIAEIKETGVVIVRGVVPRDEALGWKESIEEHVRQNQEHVKGSPPDNIVFYALYNTKAQIQARTHPAIISTQKALLSLWHASDPNSEVSILSPISYFDGVRIRSPGNSSFVLGPHMDGGGIERWEDAGYRSCFSKILQGGDAWKAHDPYDISLRLTANPDMYNAPVNCTILRPWQGWTSLSNTRSGEGTLRVLPFVKLSTAYVILRPFFKPRAGFESSLEASDWELNLDGTEFPGCNHRSQQLAPDTHPHLRLDETIISISSVEPGDQVYWHCDMVHAVEAEHNGKNDSSVLYIPAVPLTVNNAVYLRTQRSAFQDGRPAPDFPGGEGESKFKNRYKPEDIPASDKPGRTVLGLERFIVEDNETSGGIRAIRKANAILFD